MNSTMLRARLTAIITVVLAESRDHLPDDSRRRFWDPKKCSRWAVQVDIRACRSIRDRPIEFVGIKTLHVFFIRAFRLRSRTWRFPEIGRKNWSESVWRDRRLIEWDLWEPHEFAYWYLPHELFVYGVVRKNNVCASTLGPERRK